MKKIKGTGALSRDTQTMSAPFGIACKAMYKQYFTYIHKCGVCIYTLLLPDTPTTFYF